MLAWPRQAGAVDITRGRPNGQEREPEIFANFGARGNVFDPLAGKFTEAMRLARERHGRAADVGAVAGFHFSELVRKRGAACGQPRQWGGRCFCLFRAIMKSAKLPKSNLRRAPARGSGRKKGPSLEATARFLNKLQKRIGRGLVFFFRGRASRGTIDYATDFLFFPLELFSAGLALGA